MLSCLQIRGVFLGKTASKYFPFAGQGAFVFLVSEMADLLWKTICARNNIWLPYRCKNSAAGSACLHYPCATEGTERKDTEDYKMLRKILVKLCFSE